MPLYAASENIMLETLGGAFISLHSDDPGTTGANEIGIARAAVAAYLTAATGGAKTNSASVIPFTPMPAATVQFVGLWDAASGGNFLGGWALTAPVTAPDSSTFKFDLNQFLLTFA